MTQKHLPEQYILRIFSSLEHFLFFQIQKALAVTMSCYYGNNKNGSQ